MNDVHQSLDAIRQDAWIIVLLFLFIALSILFVAHPVLIISILAILGIIFGLIGLLIWLFVWLDILACSKYSEYVVWMFGAVLWGMVIGLATLFH